jgi:uncharacterized protein YndB with AHSA1/START domain/catechol 2,3-dioxygenase-like lactoylglutathione lyase family enzyme
MRIRQTSILVDDQDRALTFYTSVLGFVKKGDLRALGRTWLTVVSPQEPDGIELILEPNTRPAAQRHQKAMFDGGIPCTAFAVDDIEKECERMKGLGAAFRGSPTKSGPKIIAVLDDTCGNLIQIYQPNFVRITRRFDASAERVFDAWINPQTASKWLFTSATSESNKTEIDARVGGKWMISDRRDGTAYTGIGEYLEIDRPRRLVFTFGMPQFSAYFSRVVIEVAPDGRGCVLTLTQEGVLVDHEKGTENGWGKMFDSLVTALGYKP